MRDFYKEQVPEVDKDRLVLCQQMTEEQRMMFALGLSYYSAFLTQGEVDMGRNNISEGDLNTLKIVKSILKDYNFITKLNDDEVPSDRDRNHKLSEYNRWFKPCDRCGYDTGRASEKSEARCWKCGNFITRDYSNRALKNRKQI